MRQLTFGAALAALLMVLFGGTAAAQDREEPRRSRARSGFSGVYFTHTVREDENLTTDDAYDGAGGLIQHYFGHRRDGLIGELRRYDTNWRTIREWCRWPEGTPRTARTEECPQEHLRYSIRRSVGRTIFIPLSLIEREARRDRSPEMRDLTPEERVTRRLRQLAESDRSFRRQLETLGTAHAAYVAAGSVEAPEPAVVARAPGADEEEADGADAAAEAAADAAAEAEHRELLAARERILQLEDENRELRAAAGGHAGGGSAGGTPSPGGGGGGPGAGDGTGAGDRLLTAAAAMMAFAADVGLILLCVFLLWLLVKLAFEAIRWFRTKWQEKRIALLEAERDRLQADLETRTADLAKSTRDLASAQQTVEEERTLAGTFAAKAKELEERLAERPERVVRVGGGGVSAVEAGLRAVGSKLLAPKPDAATIEKRAVEVMDVVAQAASAFGTKPGDIPALKKAVEDYARHRTQGDAPSDEKDQAVARLKQRIANIEDGTDVPTRYVALQANLEQAERELEDERAESGSLRDELEELRKAHAADLEAAQKSAAAMINDVQRAHAVEVARLQSRIIAKGELLEAMALPEDEQSKALRRLLDERSQRIDILEGILAGQAFDELKEYGANGGTYSPPGTTMIKLDQLDQLRDRSKTEPPPPGGNGAGGPASHPPIGTSPGVVAPAADAGGEVLAVFRPETKRPTQTYGLAPQGDAEAEAAVTAEMQAVAPLLAPPAVPLPEPDASDDDEEPEELEAEPTQVGKRREDDTVVAGPHTLITCDCGRAIKRKNLKRHQKRCKAAKPLDIREGAPSTEE